MKKDPLRIAQTADPRGITVYRLGGRLDAYGSVQFRDRCGPPGSFPERIVINLSEVTFISSSGIGLLLALSEIQHERGWALHVAAPRGSVRTTIELMNLEDYLTVHETEEQALAAAA